MVMGPPVHYCDECYCYPCVCDRDDEENDTGCCFPGRCCMPGEHLRSECHTAEMMAQMIEDGEA
jgi:hypothetical protein